MHEGSYRMSTTPVIGSAHGSTTVESRNGRIKPTVPPIFRPEPAPKALKQTPPAGRWRAFATQTPSRKPATPPIYSRIHAPRVRADVLQPKAVLSHPRYYHNQNPHAIMPVKREEIFKLHALFGQYRLQRREQHGHYVPNARYIFVSQTNGDVLMHPRYRHPTLAEGKPVLYAGEVEFKNGELSWWSNASGNYRPDPGHAEQAGLPMERFCTHEQIRAGVHKRPAVAENQRSLSPLNFRKG